MIFGVPLEVSWLQEVVAFVPKPPLGVEDVSKLVAPCERSLCVDVAIVPKTAPVKIEDEGFTAPVELLVAVVLGVWLVEVNRFVPNSPPVVEEDGFVNNDPPVVEEDGCVTIDPPVVEENGPVPNPPVVKEDGFVLNSPPVAEEDGFVPNDPPVVEEDEGLAIPNG